jgi:hypothetical protein
MAENFKAKLKVFLIQLRFQANFEGIASCASIQFHLAKTRVIEAGQSHENSIQVANGHVTNYSYFLCIDDAHNGHVRT